MSAINREVAFVIMLGSSLVIGALCKLVGSFRYKKELLSLIGLAQLMWFCSWDVIHLFLMIAIGTTLIKVVKCGPRVVFIYCMLHRIFFSSSKYMGLPRDESNLANATVLVATLKMIIVAYEIADFRRIQKGQTPNERYKMKWINLDAEPSAFDIFCFMTCFVAVFTGPVFRYKTYHDMFHKYVDAPVRKELFSRFRACAVLGALFWYFVPYSADYYKDGRFYEHNFPMRLVVMSVIALTQGIKYALCWVIVETTCVLVGLGGYPDSTKPIPGMGPSIEPSEEELKKDATCNFDTISTIKFVDTLSSPTVKGALQTWNHCTQWWLAYFVYSSSIFPPSWKLIRVFSVLLMSAVIHGIKVGYFMSFPMLIIPLVAEDIWTKEIETRMEWNTLLCVFYKLNSAMTLLNREVTFVLMLGTSFAFGVIIRLLGQFRYKNEALSLMGLVRTAQFGRASPWLLNVFFSVATLLSAGNLRFNWIFLKSLVLFYLISVFVLQEYSEIIRFGESVYFFGYVVPTVYLVLGLFISRVLPKRVSS